MASASATQSWKDQAFGDLARELRVTRTVLDRLPEDKFAWKPHEKSMSLGRLAMHVATLPQWMVSTLEQDELDLANPPKIRTEPESKADLLKTFDQNVAAVTQALAAADEAALARPWSLRQGQQVLHSNTKAMILRLWCLNHLIHHRAQLCLYLRLLNVPVPAVYFNSADEPDWKFDESVDDVLMDSVLQNFLFRNPQFYEYAYPEANDETPDMCRRMFQRYLPQPPRSILDVGCGTARDLNSLSRAGADCWGVDFTPEMIAFAHKRHPHLHLQVGDARSVRLGRTFDAILTLGSAFVYSVTNTDVSQVLDTFAAHAHPGTLLIVDIANAASFLGGEFFKPTGEVRIHLPDFSAHAQATYSFDRRRQLLIRRRKWKIEGQGEREEYCEHRLFFPAELDHLLSETGFQVAGMFDNLELRDSDLCGLRLYVAAIYRPQISDGNQTNNR